MKRIAYGLSDIGRRRLSNEDAFLVDDELGLYVVADGMGGHNAGEVASGEAVDVLQSMVKRERNALSTLDELPAEPDGDVMRRMLRLLESAVQAATYMVFGLAQNEPDQQGMGTTLSALAIAGNVGITAQVGDSRIYLVRDGEAAQLTEDHTLIAWQIKQGIITAEEAARSPHKNVITRAVGSRDYVQVDTACFPVRAGDAFLLCSDGLHGYLRSNGEIPPILDLGATVAVRRLIDLANERGGKDNITAVVVEIS